MQSYQSAKTPTIADFVNLPGVYRHRIEKAKQVSIRFLTVANGNDKDWLRFEGVANGKYNTILEAKIVNNTIDYRSPAKAMCMCDSFKYEFAWVLDKNNGLADDFLFAWEFTMRPAPPMKKNKMQIVGVCKHLIKFIQVVMSRRLGGIKFRTDPTSNPRELMRMELMELQRQMLAVRFTDLKRFQELQTKVKQLSAKLYG